MRQGYTFDCALCSVTIGKPQYLTIDHIIPKSCGGSDEYENLQPAHRLCNERKGNQEPEVLFEVYKPSERYRRLQNYTA